MKVERSVDPLLVGFLVIFSVFLLVLSASALSSVQRINVVQRQEARRYLSLSVVIILVLLVVIVALFITTKSREQVGGFVLIVTTLLVIMLMIVALVYQSLGKKNRIVSPEYKLPSKLLWWVTTLCLIIMFILLALFLYVLSEERSKSLDGIWSQQRAIL